MQALPKSKEEKKQFLYYLPKNSGVYSFIGDSNIPIYIGKAKNLKNRLTSYFRNSINLSQKVNNLMNEALYLDVTITNNELEALLLEQRLIKELKPKYNVQFKDDKGYPWIRIESSKEFPSAKSFLGKKDKKETYFGPFPSSYAVKDALSLVQKSFKLRNCSDSFFKNRTRPCLQYEIGRCSAPCVGFISKNEYLQEVNAASLVLEGKAEDLIANFYSLMDLHSKKMSYERAAMYRDKISALRDIQRNQSIAGFTEERDAITLSSISGVTKIGITHVFKGWITGHENFIQEVKGMEESIVSSFIKSHYLTKCYCPKIIVVEENFIDKSVTEKALSKFHKKNIRIITKPGRKDKGLLLISSSNTNLAAERVSRNIKDISSVLKSLQNLLDLSENINIIESYDISHHSGTGAVGGCVVYSKEGKMKDQYRLYNIDKKNAGNDIASMKEIIKRRFNSEENKDNPSLILIDGGKAHLNAVKNVLNDQRISNIELLAISKGARRKAEMDSIHRTDGSVMRIEKGSTTHLFIQEIRDETHRFSIMNQKKKRSKNSLSSSLDEIKNLGEIKKKLLLRYFGSLEQIERASMEDLKKVSGIGPTIASLIYNQLH